MTSFQSSKTLLSEHWTRIWYRSPMLNKMNGAKQNIHAVYIFWKSSWHLIVCFYMKSFSCWNYFIAMKTPTLGNFSLSFSFKLTSPATVMENFLPNFCWIRAPTLPLLLSRAFNSVQGNNACWAPTVTPIVSSSARSYFTSAAIAVLDRGFTSK